MLKWFIKQGLRFVSYETLVTTLASCFSYLLEYARKNASQDGWKKAKKAVKEIKNWTTLFDEVYADDTLTEDEETVIQEAIANCTATKSIYNLLQSRKPVHTRKLKKS